MGEDAAPLKGIKALTFDVFGTVVDWRGSIHLALVKAARNKIASPAFGELPEPLRARFRAITDVAEDTKTEAKGWAAFAHEWHASYGDFTRSFVPGETEWKDIDAHHRDSLAELLRRWDVAGVYAEESDEIRSLARSWHDLRPWDDAAPGLKALGTRFVTATLSNGNRGLLEDLETNGDLGFKRIISAADFGAYKPHPSTYLGAAAALQCRPDEVAMVAAHLGDLQGARVNGLRTVYVERDREETWSQDEDRWKEAREWVDVWISQDEEGFLELARRLSIS